MADFISPVLTVIQKIAQAAGAAKANKRMCRELAERWERLGPAIQDLRFMSGVKLWIQQSLMIECFLQEAQQDFECFTSPATTHRPGRCYVSLYFQIHPERLPLKNDVPWRTQGKVCLPGE